MGNKKKVIGQCHLCGKVTELTREHVPPKMALNNEKLIGIEGQELVKALKKEDFRKSFSQNGFNVYSLCASCNNNTGTWYAKHYVAFCRSVAYYLQNKKDNVNFLILNNPSVEFGYVLKQILCMFVSFLDNKDVQSLGFDKYLLEKDNFEIDTSKFKLYAYINKEYVFETLGKAVEGTTNGSYIYASIRTYPLGFILNFNPKKEKESWKYMLDMKKLFGIGNKKVAIEIGLPIIKNTHPFFNWKEIFCKKD